MFQPLWKNPKDRKYTDPRWTGKVGSCYFEMPSYYPNPSHCVYCERKLAAESVDKTILFWR